MQFTSVLKWGTWLRQMLSCGQSDLQVLLSPTGKSSSQDQRNASSSLVTENHLWPLRQGRTTKWHEKIQRRLKGRHFDSSVALIWFPDKRHTPRYAANPSLNPGPMNRRWNTRGPLLRQSRPAITCQPHEKGSQINFCSSTRLAVMSTTNKQTQFSLTWSSPWRVHFAHLMGKNIFYKRLY